MSAIDIAHLKTWVGRERIVEDALSPFPAHALASALNRSALPDAGDALPPAWHWPKWPTSVKLMRSPN